jgi:hypothetical protein
MGRTREDAVRLDLKEALDQMARETGLPVDSPPEGPMERQLDLGGCRLHHALRFDASSYPGACFPPRRAGWLKWDVILESDRIRVLERGEAVRFWQGWWRSHPELEAEGR